MRWQRWAHYAQAQISLALDCADDQKEAEALLACAAESIGKARSELGGGV